MSLAAIKRRVTIGSKLQVVRHDWPALRLHNETDEHYKAKREAFFAVRLVVIVKPGEIGVQTGDSVSYLTWPKAHAVRETAKGFQVDLKGTGDFAEVVEYEFR